MKKALPLILIGILFISLVDSLGSIASREMNFYYGYLLPLSLAIYTVIPFLVTKRVNKKAAIISAGLLGVFDATFGWKMSTMLHANTGNTKFNIAPAVVAVTIVIVTFLSTLFGLLGSWLALKFLPNKSN